MNTTPRGKQSGFRLFFAPGRCVDDHSRRFDMTRLHLGGNLMQRLRVGQSLHEFYNRGVTCTEQSFVQGLPVAAISHSAGHTQAVLQPDHHFSLGYFSAGEQDGDVMRLAPRSAKVAFFFRDPSVPVVNRQA